MDLSKYTVMIVDDEEAYRKILAHIIQKEFKAKTVVCKNPAEAFTFLNSSIPDLILLDMQMPMMDGVTFLKKLRSVRETKNIPVIACSALSNRELILTLGTLHISDYIVKTSDTNTYKHKIYKVLFDIYSRDNAKNESQVDNQVE